MKINLAQNEGMRRFWLRFLIVFVLTLGVLFRFVNLDKKVYWPDEVVTSVRISGYAMRDFVRQVFDGHEVGIEDLQRYQRINDEKNLFNTIEGLATEEPQLPPLYFLTVRFWAQWFGDGDSVATVRSLSAVISLLAFPSLYWLCIELFGSVSVGWMAIALIAVSPFHVLYAQEARPYSLWIVTILVSSVALLRAMRLQSKLSWAIYAATVMAGLYTFLFSGLVMVGHGVYVFASEGFKLTKKIKAFLLASLVAVVAFTPWLFAVIANLSKVQSGTDWAAEKVSFFSLVAMWAGNVSRLFLDLGVGSDDSFESFIALIPSIFILLIMTVYSIYFICKNSPKRIWLFILMSIAVTWLALVVPDLIFGGRRSGVTRYTIPCYLGIQLAVAYLLAAKIERWRLWRGVAIALLLSGIFSCALASEAQVWWNKGPDRTKYNPQVAYIINQTTRPLLLSDANPAHILSLSYLLNPKVRFQLVDKPKIFKISQGFSDVFLYKPSEKFRRALEEEEKLKFKPIEKLGKFQDKLWRLNSVS